MGGYDSLINDYEEGYENGDPNEEEHQGLPDSSDKDYIIYNSEKYMTANYYGQYIGAEVVLSNRKADKLIGKFRKIINYNCISTG